MTQAKSEHQFHAWDPGLESEIPPQLLPAVTLFRADNATVSYADAKEISAFTGLAVNDLICFRPERLVIHELLIRVSADLSVPDGPTYEILGINMRAMVSTIFEKHIRPNLSTVTAVYDDARRDAEAYIAGQLNEHIFKAHEPKPAAEKPGFLARLFGKTPSKAQLPSVSEQRPEERALTHWQAELNRMCNAPDFTPAGGLSLEQACLEALIKIVGGITGHRGRLINDAEMVTRLCVNHVCNTYGSERIGAAIEPMVEEAAAARKYRRLPAQDDPVVMNVKGSSAAGKSTIRPQQRKLAEKLGVPWDEFALISPDYWRKYLLDYDSLGVDYKYAAMLTGQELELIDKKLDRYMAQKAHRGAMPHMLIDRFRFDSFSLGKDSKLLSRFGNRIFMFFVVTPPAATVERAWQRGLKTGRYKAVDDLLYHNVEAFTGMPELFFSWVLSADKQVHFEFLDNDVPYGERPKTGAFGWNNSMIVLDPSLMIDIDRFRQVNVDAQSEDQVHDGADMKPAGNTGFIQKAADVIADILFADADSAKIYARIRSGKLVWWDRAFVAACAPDSEIAVALAALGLDAEDVPDDGEKPAAIDIDREQIYTLGRWCGA